MTSPTLRILVMHGVVGMPKKANINAAGFDLQANIEKPLILKAGERELIGTGIKLGIPDGYEVQVRPRSGLAGNHGLTILNAPGTIDSDYIGELKIILYNSSHVDFEVLPGMRIAQAIFARVQEFEMLQVDYLEPTERGENGYGSTGLAAL
jgi:dUTP pyrophosphatase